MWRKNVEFLLYVYDFYLYETGVILTGDWLCKKEWLGINCPKILIIEDLRILYKIPIHLVF